MKKRTGFVSNSSSSSFTLSTKDISAYQAFCIINYRDCSHIFEVSDGWGVTFHEDTLSGDTSMDNGDMSQLMDELGVPPGVVEWED